MQHLAQWDDVEGARREAGQMGGTWRDLGSAAGAVGVGVSLVDVDSGKCWYPRSSRISLPGVGVIGRIEPADSWDGEP